MEQSGSSHSECKYREQFQEWSAATETSCAARWPPQYAPAPADRRPIGPICGPGQELPTAYVRAKIEDRSFIRLRNIGTFR